jgi:hypothetical protein
MKRPVYTQLVSLESELPPPVDVAVDTQQEPQEGSVREWEKGAPWALYLPLPKIPPASDLLVQPRGRNNKGRGVESAGMG